MLATQVIGAAVAHEAEVLFGLPGSGNFLTINAARDAGVRFVGTVHEAGAVGMADGYARTTGRVGVASVHQGPGVTNTLTALTEAVKSHTPLVLLAADVGATVHRHQKVDQDRLVGSLGAGVVRLDEPEAAGLVVRDAFARATAERRPIVTMLPTDVAGQPASYEHAPAEHVVQAGVDVSIANAATAAARRPLVLAGRGALGAEAELLALAERIGGLLATTMAAKGLFAVEPFCIGVLGGLASPVAAELGTQADLVLAFGTSLDPWTTSDGRAFAPHARVVLVDDDERALAAHADVASVHGDCAAVASSITDKPAARWRSAELAALIRGGRVSVAGTEAGDELDPRLLALALDERLPADRIVSVDSGHFLVWPSVFVGVARPRSFLFVQGFQAVGLGLGVAIGAAVADPYRITCAMLGDGGAQMSLFELDTAVREELPLLVTVFNDRAYGAEVHDFAPHGIPTDIAKLPDRDFAAIARALGARGETIRSLDDLGRLDSWLAEPDGPLVLDCKVDPRVDATSVMTAVGRDEWSLPNPLRALQPHGGS